jgi:hypothetical protein
MRAPAFQFYPKQWLGDDKVMAMDWDARAMHMHLMCISWQQEPPCTLPDDDDMIRRWLGNPRRWNVLKQQVFSAWKLIDGRWVQSGLLTQFQKQSAYIETRKHGANARWSKDAHASEMQCIKDAFQSSSSTSSSSSPSDKGKRSSASAPLPPLTDLNENREELIPAGLAITQYANFAFEQNHVVAPYGLKVQLGDAIEMLAEMESCTVEVATKRMLDRMRAAPANTKWNFWIQDGGWKKDNAKSFSLGLEDDSAA